MTNTSVKDNHQFQVLIVGAGPVGLLLANLLGQKGVSCLLIDKRTVRPEWSRAIGLTPPSLGILEQAGLHHQFIRRGVRVRNAYVHDDYGYAGRVNFDDISATFQYILAIPQAVNMEILEKKLDESEHVVFERGQRLTSVNCCNDSVHASFTDEKTGCLTNVSGKWLIGCDGCSSTTRELVGIPFRRRSYKPRFVMADYYDTTDWQDDAHLFFTKEGSLESFPLHDKRRRWVALVTQQEGEADADFLERQTKRLSNQNLEGRRCSKVFDFIPERIKVNSLYKDRVILAGDSAHVMTPIGGQGMNTGFGDTEYLSNILPMLLEAREGINADDLLQVYNRCRQKAAGASRRHTASGMWLGTRTGSFASDVRSFFLRSVLLKGPLSRRLASSFAMLKVPCNRFDAKSFF